MSQHPLKVSAIAFAVSLSFGNAQAAELVSTSIDTTHNIYYTGKFPAGSGKEKMPAQDTAVDATKYAAGDYYMGERMALDNYPTFTPVRCTDLGASNPDTTRTCYGDVPVVIDLTNFDSDVYIRVPSNETVASSGPAGSGSVANNGLAAGAIIAVWADVDYSDFSSDASATSAIDDDSLNNEAPSWWSSVLTTYDGLTPSTGTAPFTIAASRAALTTYANADAGTGTIEPLLDQDTDGGVTGTPDSHLDDNLRAQAYRTNYPGFRELNASGAYTDGAEFAVFSSTDTANSDGYYVANFTKPANATHLILGLNMETGSFTNNGGTPEAFSVELAENAEFNTFDTNVTLTPTVTSGGQTLSNNGTAGQYDVEVDSTVTIAAGVPGSTTVAADAYIWKVDGVTVSGETGDTLQQTLSATGTVQVQVSVEDATNSVTGSETLTFNVQAAEVPNVAPTASFTSASSVEVNTAIKFTDTSTDSDGTIASRAWTFGDGSTSTATSPSHTYTTAGEYTVTLVVTDEDGAESAAATKTVTVSEAATTGGGGGGALSWFFGLGLLAPAFIRRRFQK